MRNTIPLFALSSLLAASLAAGSPTISLPLKVEKLNPPTGETWPAFDRLELDPRGHGHYSLRLVPGQDAPSVSDFDLMLLVPRVPALVRGNPALTKIALIQREFNRNETHNDLGNGLDFSIANNCLKQGLWEVKLYKKADGKSTMIFHAWLTFPRDEYAKLFEELNGLKYAEQEKLFADYPALGGLPVPLSDLRKIQSERISPAPDVRSKDPLARLTEQQSKVKLLLTQGVASFGDFSAPDKQPIATARFSEPGFYNPEDPVKFSLTWLSTPKRIVWRKVKSATSADEFPEVEILFENGYRILLADPLLARLSARDAPPTKESEVLKFICGIGTPNIQADVKERAKELSEDRPRYLLLLDPAGNLIDNHLAGMDGMYVWREASVYHFWVLGYERIALIAHFSTPGPASDKPAAGN
jgi:hypothetical protein